MFRIIIEGKNKAQAHILIEGIDKIKSFKSDLVLVSARDTLIKLLGKEFYIDKLGEGYMQISGELFSVSYGTPDDNHINIS